jgi:hypothetical protein
VYSVKVACGKTDDRRRTLRGVSAADLVPQDRCCGILDAAGGASFLLGSRAKKKHSAETACSRRTPIPTTDPQDRHPCGSTCCRRTEIAARTLDSLLERLGKGGASPS